MLPDKSGLKLLASNPSGLNALLDYLESLRASLDADFTSAARGLVFDHEGNKETAIITYGKIRAIENLIDSITSMTSIRGDK